MNKRCTALNKTNRKVCKRKAVDQHFCVQHQRNKKFQYHSELFKELEHLVVDADTIQIDETKILGEGGYGSVYQLNESQVVKVTDLLPQRKYDAIAAELRVFRAIQKHPHPGIVKVEAIANHRQSSENYLVLEYMELGDFFVNSTKLTWPEKLQICHRMTQVVHHLHTQCKILYRDLKQENILLRQKDIAIECKLCDFGLSTSLINNEEELKKSTGSVFSFAPEMFNEDLIKDEKSDSWAFGVLLYELLHDNKTPFDNELAGGDDMVIVPALIEQRCTGRQFPRCEKAMRECAIYEECMKLVDDCFIKDRELRISMSDIIVRLQHLLDAANSSLKRPEADSGKDQVQNSGGGSDTL